MSQELQTFHDQLLLFLQEDLKKKKIEEGWDDRYDEMMRSYSNAISQAIRSSAPMPLEEIIEQHQYLFQGRGPMHLEQKLLLSFPDSEMVRFAIPTACVFIAAFRAFIAKISRRYRS